MSRIMSKKNRKKRKKPYPIKKRNIKHGKNKPIILALFFLCIIGIIIYYFSPGGNKAKYKESLVKPGETSFQKEGELVFIDNNTQEIIKEIDIEIAENTYERNQGLMYRYTMNDNNGMLFIYDNSGLRTMWMKNTYISLDIIFANEDYEIVSIHKNAIPLSTNIISSYKDAIYVVEVVAGFCDKYRIKEGNKVRFEYIRKPLEK
jgi:uncharacterized membrane protein (UPF0127 family)